MNLNQLPIDAHIAEIVRAVREHPCVIVEAPPGAGKTTRVAPALLPTFEAGVGKVVLIQPRRIAARAAASRIAAELGVAVGQRVGYQVRFDRCVSQSTQLIAMTPGVLLRQLQSDATLADTAIVVLDEFHERSLEYDLLLGMLRRLQMELRSELRLVIMSATLDTASINEYLQSPPTIRVPGQLYPVKIHYSRFGERGRISELASRATLAAAEKHAGDILVFLPGVGEIMQVARELETRAERESWDLLTLFGDMSPSDQDRVLMPSARRKIILSTNVAETSLTIDGVTVVVDSGWARVQRVEAGLGLNLLQLEPISKASAEQRAGRAGRTQPGVCYRLWDEATHRTRLEHLEPEVLRVDLAAAVLQLLCWGEADPAAFPWITAPRSTAIEQAQQLLEQLDATLKGRPTELGRLLLSLPVHPRLGRLLIAGHANEIPAAAALAAAMLSERDVFDRQSQQKSSRPFTRESRNSRCDLTQRVIWLSSFLQRGDSGDPQVVVRPAAARQVARVAEDLLRQLTSELGACEEAPLDEQLGMALLTAFPDRLARRRAAHDVRGLMVGGRGVKLESQSGVRESELFLCLDVDAKSSDASVRMASSVDAEWLPLRHLRQADDRFLHPTQGTVVTRRRTYWFDLVIEETPIATPLDEETAAILAEAAITQWNKVLPKDDKSLNQWLHRIQWLREAMPDSGLPDFSAEGLRASIGQWCFGMRSLTELSQLPWRSLLEGMLSSSQRSSLAQQAPESYQLPSGRNVALQYELGKPPILAAKIQEFFGLSDTPRIAGGRVALLLHLLAPNQRCQQITDDLASFWKNTYPVVRKELRGRYPKHAWPEDPFSKSS